MQWCKTAVNTLCFARRCKKIPGTHRKLHSHKVYNLNTIINCFILWIISSLCTFHAGSIAAQDDLLIHINVQSFLSLLNLWPEKYPRKVSCTLQLHMCKTYCYLSKISLPPIQATILFLSTFPNKVLSPRLHLSGARIHLETAFETSFCISVVTWWGMQVLSQKRWCTSSQSWFISVLWGEQWELHSSSSTSHVESLRWLFSCH